MNGAVFSPCRVYRYTLWRHWAHPARMVAFIGLNPSTADETQDDPTIRRCIGFAKAWNFDGLYMLNAFAYRSTDPAGLRTVDDPVGPLNNFHLLDVAAKSKLIVAAWGNHATLLDRQAAVVKLLADRLHCLGTNANGSPKHPLYLKKSAIPVKYEPNGVLTE